MNDQEKIMSALAQGYQVLSKAMKQKPSKEGFQLVLLMLGDDGILACVQVADQGPEAIAQTMAKVILEKQTQKAEKGAKLNRLMALNDSCPEDYLKKGGKCKKCEKGEKLNPHKALFTPAAYFKNGGINKLNFGNIIGAIGKVKDVLGKVGVGNQQNNQTGGGIQTAANAIGAGLGELGKGIAEAKLIGEEYKAKRAAEENKTRLAAAQYTLQGLKDFKENLEKMNTLANLSTANAAAGYGGMNNPNNFLANLQQLYNILQPNLLTQPMLTTQNTMWYDPRKQKMPGLTLTGTTPTWMK